MLEALVQSRWLPELTEIELLPAAPVQWNEGSLAGVHVRGGAVIDLAWKHGKITSLQLRANSDGMIRLIPARGQVVSGVRSSNGKSQRMNEGGAFHSKTGTSYSISFD